MTKETSYFILTLPKVQKDIIKQELSKKAFQKTVLNTDISQPIQKTEIK